MSQGLSELDIRCISRAEATRDFLGRRSLQMLVSGVSLGVSSPGDLPRSHFPVWLTMGDRQSTCMFLLLGVPSHPVLSGAEHEETARRKRGAGGPEGVRGQAAEGGGEQVREAEVGLLRSGPGEARGGLT